MKDAAVLKAIGKAVKRAAELGLEGGTVIGALVVAELDQQGFQVMAKPKVQRHQNTELP